MPSHSPAVHAPRIPRLTRAAGIALAAATCATAVAVTIVTSDDQPTPQVRSIAAPSQAAATTRTLDIEANKAVSMRALGHHIAQPLANPATRYDDVEANKARSQRAH